jgi:hemerythrin-like metal-binding protein
MPLMTWNDDYSVNNEMLDSHHRKLITILNHLYGECLKVEDIDCVGPQLDELLSYADYHFKAEEEYMRQIEYFDRDEHIEKHNGFAYKIEELRRITHESQLELTRELIVYIGKWLLNHVLVDDKKYAVHAAGRGNKQ